MSKSAATSVTGADFEIMEFEIDERDGSGGVIRGSYGISVSKVSEIIKTPEKITPTAKDHPAVEGVIDLRGEVIPVLNLPKWLQKFDPSFKYERIIVAEFNLMKVGFLVSRANRIYRVPYENFTPPTTINRGGNKMLTTGVVRNEGRLLLMMDFEGVMADVEGDGFTDFSEVPVASNKGGLVFLLDDSKLVLSALRKLFVKAGYTVIEAANGEEGLELLERLYDKDAPEGKSLPELIRAIVTDVEMPLMDGIKFVETIKGDKRFQSVPVVIFSSVVNDELSKKWKEAGVNAIVQKPMAMELINYVNEFATVSDYGK
jgi:two-component system chemotaxis response regulator CheV